MITESRFSQDCFLWFTQSFPLEVGRLILLHNNPQNKIMGAKLKAMGMFKGVADYLYLMPQSKVIFIELKTEIGVQSKHQVWFEKLVNCFDNEYYAINNLEAFKDLIYAKGRLTLLLPQLPVVSLKTGK